MGVNNFLRNLDVGAIRPTYGNNLDFILFGWIQAFQTHEDAFGALNGYISREAVLHLQIPVVSIGTDQYPIAVEIRIPPRFPENDPQCKLVHQFTGANYPRGGLPINHTAVSSYDYQIDLRKLASMSGNLPLQSYSPNKGTPSIVQLLAAISNVVNDAMESVVQRPPPPPPPSSSSTNQQQQQNTPSTSNTTSYQPSPASASVTPRTTTMNNTTNTYRDPNNNNNNSSRTNNNYYNQTTQQQPQSPATPAGNHLGSPLNAPKQVVDAVSTRVKEFFEQREAALKTLGHLQGSQDTLQRLLKNLNDKKSTLSEANQEISQMAKLCDQVVSSKPPSALKCIDATDQLSDQGFTLLAEVQACDDIMEALEKRLRVGNRNKSINNNNNNNFDASSAGSFALATPGAMFPNHQKQNQQHDDDETPTTNYLRLVGNIARRQFMAKFLLRKVQGKRLASRNMASLVNRFSELDSTVIRAVLESNAFDAVATAQRLTEMTRA